MHTLHKHAHAPPSLRQAKGKTSEAITKLCQLAPPSATLLELDGQGRVLSEREVPTDLVHRGDVLKVLPGARMPTDGVVLGGSSYANESMLTGESGGRGCRRLCDPCFKLVLLCCGSQRYCTGMRG